MEQSRLGIASVIGAFSEYRDAQGQVVDGQTKFSAALVDAEAIQEKLKIAALETTASYGEMLAGFQVGLAPMSKAGIALNDTVEAVQRLTQAAGALGIPMNQLQQEIRGVFEGDVSRQSRLNQVLGFTKDQIAELSRSGGLMDELRKRTEQFALAGGQAAQTLTGLWSNFKDALEQLLGKGMKPLFDELKAGLRDGASAFVEITKEGIGFKKDVVDGLMVIGTTIAAVFKIGLDIVKEFFAGMSGGVKSAGLTWVEVFKGIGVVVIEFFGMVQRGAAMIGQYLASPFETFKASLVTMFSGILSMLSELLEKLAKVPIIGAGMDQWAKVLRDVAVDTTNASTSFQKFSAGVEATNTRVNASVKSWTDKIAALGIATDATAKKTHDYTRSSIKGAEDATKAEEKRIAMLLKLDQTILAIRKTQEMTTLEKIRFDEEEVRSAINKRVNEIDQALLTVEERERLLAAMTKAVMESYRREEQETEKHLKKTVGLYENHAKFIVKETESTYVLGMTAIAALVPTVGQTITNAFSAVWQAAANTFDTMFVTIIKGDLDGLTDVFKRFGESLLSILSKVFSDILLRWIALQLGISQNPLTGQFQFTGNGAGGGGTGLAGIFGGVGILGSLGIIGGAAASGNWGATAGGAAGLIATAGFGLGMSGAAAGGLFGGAASGAIAGSVVPIIGTVIGAIIGIIVGALLKGSTEIKTRISGSSARFGGTPEGQAIWGVYGQTLGTLADIAEVGGGSRTELMKFMRANRDEFLRSSQITVHAGKPEDLQQDWKDYLQKYFPQSLISMAFGQEAQGFKDLPGVTGVVNFRAGTFDPNAPIPKMLAGLGFTADAIGAIARQINLRDAEDFLNWLGRLTSVVKAMSDLATEFRKTAPEIFADLAAEEAKSPAEQFAKGAERIVELAGELSVYTGDEQLRRAEEIVELGRQYYDAQVAYLKSLYDLQKSITESVEQQIRGMRLETMTPEQRNAFLMTETTGLIGALAKATSPQEISDIMRQIQANVSALFTSATDKTGILGLLEGLLTQARDAATARIEALAAEAVAQNPKLADAMAAASRLFTDMGPQLDAVNQAAGADAAALSGNAAAASASAGALWEMRDAIADATDAVLAFRAGFAGSASQTIATVKAQPAAFAPATGV